MTQYEGLAGKVALVTGAASGMARATAEMLAEDGVKLALLDLDAAGLDEVVASIGKYKALAIPADLTKVQELDAAVDKATAHFGAIDILLNVAGWRNQQDKLSLVDPDNWQRTYAINVVGPARLIQKVGEGMIARGKGGALSTCRRVQAFVRRAIRRPLIRAPRLPSRSSRGSRQLISVRTISTSTPWCRAPR